MALGIGVCLGWLGAQDCPPTLRVLPNGTVAGSLNAANCQLIDQTPYAAYRLDLPVRGQIKIELGGNTTDFVLTLRDASGMRLDSGASLLRPIEAGSYTLLVNGRAAGQTGNYTVNTSFTSEPGVLCSNFPNIGRPADPRREHPRFRLPGFRRHALRGLYHDHRRRRHAYCGGRQPGFHTGDRGPLDRRAPADRCPRPSPVNVVLEGDSQYLVVISSADTSTGAYQIVNSYQTADNETCRPSKTLAAPDTDNNAITAASCFRTIAGSGDQSYYNYYNLTSDRRGNGERECGQRRFCRYGQPVGCRRQSPRLRFRRRRQPTRKTTSSRACARNSRRAVTAWRSSATFLPVATTRSVTIFKPAIRNRARPSALNLAISWIPPLPAPVAAPALASPTCTRSPCLPREPWTSRSAPVVRYCPGHPRQQGQPDRAR